MTDTTQPSTDEPDTDDAADAAGTNDDDGTDDTGTGVAGASTARKTETGLDESTGTELATDRTLGGSTADGDPGGDAADDRPIEGATDQLSPVVRYTYWGAFGLLSLLAVIALFQFYTSASTAIDLWVEPEYEPIMQAAFNLVVLLAAAIGVSRVVRELS